MLFWPLLLLAGGSGTIAAMVREYLFVRLCSILICVAAIGGLMGLVWVTAVNVVTWHYDGQEFSKLAESGYLTVRFHNTSNKKIQIRGIVLGIEGKDLNGKDQHDFSSPVPESERGYVIGPKQSVDITFPYEFIRVGYYNHYKPGTEKDTVLYNQNDGCQSAEPPCDHNPIFVKY